ncbi:DHHC palmitoyltransferase-domain-containing protein [Massariosphaeria phaeospora]|uniref:Palmitoyltransferase n=1 Tax=Massariosphaeria phaeospora TaxID=100035 RepID=A0A7C8I357_9PLEO|nr:DHHC palmitoyltransferase-domain-containing protein [Massariosphaeria phaeospora]
MTATQHDGSRDAQFAWVGRTSAVIMPLLEIGAIGFVTYVVIYTLCIQYLLNPSELLQDYAIFPRVPTAIGVLVGYFILLGILLVTILRLFQVLWTNPGLVPLGDPSATKETAPGIKDFNKYDAYVCDYQGWPIWCDICHNFKPDRAHHCSELGRCVRRMDHYCAWAGGIVSETTHKFFIQFIFYGALYTAYTLAVMSYFLAERLSLMQSRPATWIGTVALSAVFFLFTFGMTCNTLYQLSINLTTIESLKTDSIYHIALRGPTPDNTPNISEPAPARLTRFGSPTVPRGYERSASHAPSTIPPFSKEGIVLEVNRNGNHYIVVRTESFQNPWKATAMENLRSILGDRIIDWFIPLGMSPCTRHVAREGQFEWGQVVHNLMCQYEAGSGSIRVRHLGGSSHQNWTSDF